jgi:threonine dehydratase
MAEFDQSVPGRDPTLSLDGVPTLDAAAVTQAARRIAGHVNRTPVITNATLDELAAARVFVKVEPLQRSGSFKARGAFNRLLQLGDDERRRGIVAYSSGNHGAAVALAAADLDIPAVIVVPRSAPKLKLEQIRALGAELRWYDPASEDRAAVAGALADERGLTVVPPFDDLDVMAGQGTLALELIEDTGTLDLVLVPVGGGGLIAGVGTITRALCPQVRVIGVEPALADDTAQSLAAGHRIRLPGPPDTIADGLRTPEPGALTFPINGQLLEGVVTVSDEEIVEAMRLCFERLKVVVEPSGAVAVAALLAGRITAPDTRIGIVLSGGNVDASRFAELLGAAPAVSLPFPNNTRHNARSGGREKCNAS